ncbi:MAG: hypothetical protein IJ741_03660 [Schwartzia sp.]|nr:hypothetical protein [Schwartzia sp. (in: firmicutes)]
MITVTPEQGAAHIQAEVDEIVSQLNHEARSRATRAVNVLQNKAFEVLGKDGHGRQYGPHRASAPGEPPAPDSGNLRRNWRKQVLGEEHPKGVRITCRIKSDMPYSEYLEKGHGRTAPRPYKERIRSSARPEIDIIYSNL